jgi:hypothetical protein
MPGVIPFLENRDPAIGPVEEREGVHDHRPALEVEPNDLEEIFQRSAVELLQARHRPGRRVQCNVKDRVGRVSRGPIAGRPFPRERGRSGATIAPFIAWNFSPRGIHGQPFDTKT